jgi:SAM-dependent methyltransferase
MAAVFSAPVAATEADCPLCRCDRHVTLIDRPTVPVLMNRFYATRAEARAAPTGHLRIVRCDGCGFIFNSRFDPALVAYDVQYENDQAKSVRFSQYLDEMTARLLGTLGNRKARILEIGCGQGELLEALAAQGPNRIEAVGYDTAWRPRRLPPGLRIEADALDVGAMRETGAFDLVYARHVIEHVADPVALLRAMASLIGDSGRICIETPALEWILANGQMQDFFYEHCNYFTAASLADACGRAGLGPVRVETVFGGQYLWAETGASAIERRPAPMVDRPAMDRDFFVHWRQRLTALSQPIIVWGAGAKGVTFAAETDPTAELLACLVDVNPLKQGKFTPRSGHAVVAPEVAVRLGAATIVVMNPNYHAEIAGLAGAAGLRARLLPC